MCIRDRYVVTYSNGDDQVYSDSNQANSLRIGFEPVSYTHLDVYKRQARQLVRELREGSRLKLNLDGTVIPVQIKEKSLDNLKHEILEMSFQALAADQAVNSVIDIVLVNADKVTAVLEKLNMKIPYSALPADMIDTLEIDVDGMPVGTIVTVGDIPELKSEKLALQVNSCLLYTS